MDEFGRKKPSPDFVIRFVKAGIRPWKVPMRALARVLQAIQRLVDQRDEDEEDRYALVDDPSAQLKGELSNENTPRSLRLVDVRSGSAAYSVAAPAHELAVQIIRETGKAIAAPEKFEWRGSAISAIRDLSETARVLNCNLDLCLPGSGKTPGAVLAKITPQTFDEVAANVFIKGDTSIYARIERVGGTTEMHCGIRLSDQPRKMVICHVVSAELVRDLGRYMYQRVLLSGQATWLRSSRQLKYFTVTSFEPPKTGSIRDAMQRIHEAGGKAWDKVKNPGALIAEMRGL